MVVYAWRCESQNMWSTSAEYLSFRAHALSICSAYSCLLFHFFQAALRSHSIGEPNCFSLFYYHFKIDPLEKDFSTDFFIVTTLRLNKHCFVIRMYMKKLIKTDKKVRYKFSLSFDWGIRCFWILTLTKLPTSLHTASSKKHFYPRTERRRRSQHDLQGPPWHDTKQRFYVVCQVYAKKENQCNLTALHKELLCRDISFLLLSGVSRVALEGPEGSRAGENNVGSLEKRKRNMLSFLRCFFCDILFSFNRPFHVSTSSVRSDGL